MNAQCDIKSTEYRRHAALGINRDKLKQLIMEDCKTYFGEDREVFIGSDRFMARQLLGSVGKNFTNSSYCTIEGNYCVIPAHVTGYDKFGREIKSLPMVYIGEIMLLLASNNLITINVFDSNGCQISKFKYHRKGGMWNLIHTFDYHTARVVNSVLTIKDGARRRIAEKLNVSADPTFHKLFDELMEEIKGRE